MGIIGTGGMGVVLKAFDAALNRYVAIKILSPHLGNSGAARKRFSREAQAAAAVVHDNVIEIHGVADANGLPYLVMPYVRGPSLQKRLDEEGPLSTVEVLRIAKQAAAGLAEAHAQGLVHRDVKPANILLADGVERVKLTDFGLARAADDASLTKTGVIAGTPQFMSPEQARAESIDARSDLFSLGAVLYAMCVGHPPFRAETSYGVLRLITDREPRSIRELNPDIPEWLCRIIAKLMSKQPDDRFASAREVAELLEDCLAHVQQPTTVPLPPELAQLSQWITPDENAHQPNRASGRSPRKPRASALWLILGAAVAFMLVFAGVVIVLEMGNGTLTITSEADGVPIRIMQDDEVVERLTITRSGKSVRVAAGRYRVEIDGNIDGIAVADGTVTLMRGGQEAVKIVRSNETPVGGQQARVALVMMMHPAELEGGNSVQQAAASMALGQLSSKDYCGILKYSKETPQTPMWLWGGDQGVVRIGERRAELLKSIAGSDTGDFPQFDPALRLALTALGRVDAIRRHMIILTNGDPDVTDDGILKAFRKAGITVSVVHIELHGPRYAATPKRLAEATGGRYYHVLNAQPSVVETIFRDECAQLTRDRHHADAETRDPKDAGAADIGGRREGQETVPGTVAATPEVSESDTRGLFKTIRISLVLPREFQVHRRVRIPWTGDMLRASKITGHYGLTARIHVPASEPSQILVDEIARNHGLEITVAIEPNSQLSANELFQREGIRIQIGEEELAALKGGTPVIFQEAHGTALAVVKITARKRPVTPVVDIQELNGTWRLVGAELVSELPHELPIGNQNKSSRIVIRGSDWEYLRDGNPVRKLEATYDLKASPQTVDLKYSVHDTEKHERRLFELHADTLITARRVSGADDFPSSFDEPQVFIERYQRIGVVTAVSDSHKDHFSISLGSADGIRPEQRLQVSDGSSPLGTVEVTAVQENESYARVVEWTGERLIRKGDRVNPVEPRDQQAVGNRLLYARRMQNAHSVVAAAEHEQDAAKRDELLANAARLYNEISLTYRAQAMGLAARLFEAECYEKLGQLDQATEICEGVLRLSGRSPAIDDLRGKAEAMVARLQSGEIPGEASGERADAHGPSVELAEIKEAWTQRSKGVSTSRLRWTENRIYPRGEKLSPNEPEPLAADLTVAWEKKLIIAGDKCRIQGIGKAWDFRVRQMAPFEFTAVRNETGRSYHNYPDQTDHLGYFSESLKGLADVTYRPALLGTNPGDPEFGRIDLADYHVVPGVTEINGRKCIKLESNDNRSTDNQLFLDPERQFVVTRSISSTGAVVMRQLDLSYKQDSRGIWYPASWQFQVLNGNLDRHAIHIAVVATEFESDFVASPDDFEIQYRPGTLIYDQRTPGTTVKLRVQEDGSHQATSNTDTGRMPWGHLKGRFVFAGEIPDVRRVDVTKDRSQFGDSVVDESLVVDRASKGIANVLVYLRATPSRVHPDFMHAVSTPQTLTVRRRSLPAACSRTSTQSTVVD